MNPGENILQLLNTGDLTSAAKEELRRKLEVYVNDLLVNDFQQLVQLLYRIDVREAKLKALLHQHKDTDAAVLLTNLMIERQEEKARSRKQFKPPSATDADEIW
jgi:hypothetical protein